MSEYLWHRQRSVVNGVDSFTVTPLVSGGFNIEVDREGPAYEGGAIIDFNLSSEEIEYLFEPVESNND